MDVQNLSLEALLGRREPQCTLTPPDRTVVTATSPGSGRQYSQDTNPEDQRGEGSYYRLLPLAAVRENEAPSPEESYLAARLDRAAVAE